MTHTDDATYAMHARAIVLADIWANKHTQGECLVAMLSRVASREGIVCELAGSPATVLAAVIVELVTVQGCDASVALELARRVSQHKSKG